MSEAFVHAQTRARKLVVAAAGSKIEQLGPSYKLSETPPSVTARAPSLGEHTAELLAEVGISDDERNRLEDAGIIVIR
jgi:crotonobetainyl-CoA:carnitine CoA-transferase CaiB-like acyl-CoA transferase